MRGPARDVNLNYFIARNISLDFKTNNVSEQSKNQFYAGLEIHRQLS